MTIASCIKEVMVSMSASSVKDKTESKHNSTKLIKYFIKRIELVEEKNAVGNYKPHKKLFKHLNGQPKPHTSAQK